MSWLVVTLSVEGLGLSRDTSSTLKRREEVMKLVDDTLDHYPERETQ